MILFALLRRWIANWPLAIVLTSVCILSVAILPAHADLVFTMSDVSLNAGEAGSIDILINSTSNDTLFAFGFRLQIESISPEIGGSLQFAGSLTSASTPKQSNSEVLDSNYVFAGNVDASNFTANRSPVDPRVFLGSDFTADLQNVVLTTSPRLLARVELQHVTLNPAASSGTYRISLVPSASTLFNDADGNDISFVSNTGVLASGLVTVSAVPEPAAWCLMLVVAATSFAARRWRSSLTI